MLSEASLDIDFDLIEGIFSLLQSRIAIIRQFQKSSLN